MRSSLINLQTEICWGVISSAVNLYSYCVYLTCSTILTLFWPLEQQYMFLLICILCNHCGGSTWMQWWIYVQIYAEGWYFEMSSHAKLCNTFNLYLNSKCIHREYFPFPVAIVHNTILHLHMIQQRINLIAQREILVFHGNLTGILTLPTSSSLHESFRSKS